MTTRRGDLRLRLVVALAAVSAVAVAVVAVAAWVLGSAALERAARTAAATEADAVAEAVERAPAGEGANMVADLARAGRALQLIEVDGREVSRSDQLVALAGVADAPDGRVRDALVGGVPYLATVRDVDDIRLWLFFPTDRLEQSREALREALLAASGIAVVVAAVAVALLTRRVLAPVDATAAAARLLARGSLGARVDQDDAAAGFTDLTASFNEMAEALEQTVWRLERSDEVQRRFVADVSHELRTPLTVLASSADLLRPAIGDLDDVPRRAAELLLQEVDGLGRLVDDLMEVARLDAGGADLCAEAIDLPDLVDRLLQHHGWRDEVALEVVGGRDQVLVDPRRVMMIVANLVRNAMVHGAPPIDVRVIDDGDAVVVAVTDHGPGIPPEHRDHVFDRFHKIDPARTRGQGSGLGLAIARDNARLMGGDLVLYSPAQGGTRMEVVLPHVDRPDPTEQDLPVTPDTGP